MISLLLHESKVKSKTSINNKGMYTIFPKDCTNHMHDLGSDMQPMASGCNHPSPLYNRPYLIKAEYRLYLFLG